MAEATNTNGDPNVTLAMTTGVVFGLKAASTWAITEVNRQMDKLIPVVPVVWNETKGRNEPNEADPGYKDALLEHELIRAERVYEVTIITGTVIVSVPDAFPTVEDQEWVDKITAVGIEVGKDPKRRFIEWVKYVAAPSVEDWRLLTTPLLRQLGTTEEDVATLVALFRSVSRRRADYASLNGRDDPDGDRHGEDTAGAGPPVRGDGSLPVQQLQPDRVAGDGMGGSGAGSGALPGELSGDDAQAGRSESASGPGPA